MIKVFLATIVNFILSKIPWIEDDTFKEVFEFAGLNVNDYKKSQIKNALYYAIVADYDVFYLSNPKLLLAQFNVIRKGLDHGLDVSLYADHALSVNDMQFMFDMLKKIKSYEKQNAFKFINPRLFQNPLSILEYKMIKIGIDILKFGIPEMVILNELIDRKLIDKILPQINSEFYNRSNSYIKKSYDYQQLIEVALGLIHDLNISKYFDPDLPAFMMRRERLRLLENSRVFQTHYHK